MKQVIETARKLGAKVLIIKINEIEKIVYRNGRVYIVRDGQGIVNRRLFPREIAAIKSKIARGEYYYR